MICWLIAHTHAQACHIYFMTACVPLFMPWIHVASSVAVTWSHVSSDLAFSSREIVCRESFVSRGGSMLWCVQAFLRVRQQSGWKRGSIWFLLTNSSLGQIQATVPWLHGLKHKWGSERFKIDTQWIDMWPDKLQHHMEQTAAVGGQTATCALQYGQSYPPLRVSIYYKTNNRKLCWLRCENSNNPHPCVSFLPLCCWLDFTTLSSLVSPRSDVARGGLTVTRAAGYCIPSHCDWGIVCLSSFFYPFQF